MGQAHLDAANYGEALRVLLAAERATGEAGQLRWQHRSNTGSAMSV
jgi:hypothetical protein